jgi:hypothetical protein
VSIHQEDGWVEAVGVEIASLLYKASKGNGVAPPPPSNWSLLESKAIQIVVAEKNKQIKNL